MGEKKKEGGAHKALYRKYRSKSLDEIVGQEHITKTLKNAIKNGKISHAYLFTGPRGVGKTSIARILAHEINEIPYTDDSLHLDIIEIDAASNRRIDDIRDLREKVNLAPVNSKYKVYIIDEVHMLTAESFNALLKTLEEPPEHVIFILATTEVHKLPATIVSRTQRHTFRAVPKEKVVNHLKEIADHEGIDIEDAALELLAEHGEGSFRDSISLLDQVSHLPIPVKREAVEELLGVAPHESTLMLLEATKKGDTKKLIQITRSLREDGIAAQSITSQLLTELRARPVTEADIALMGRLLSIGTSTHPDIALELALLQTALASESPPTPAPAKTTAATVSPPHKTSTTPIKQPSEHGTTDRPVSQPLTKKKPEHTNGTNDADPAPTPTIPQDKTSQHTEEHSEQLEEFWPDILKEVKERNSSLYTIMRLAKPTLEGETLTLSFQFPFHKKRMDDVKHLSLVVEIVSNHINLQPIIQTTVNSAQEQMPVQSARPTPSTASDPAHASLIASVQDIMGGGEVIDANNI